MNQHLQHILTIVHQEENLSAEQKEAIEKSIKNADKELEITAFKLDRTEKEKRTTAILPPRHNSFNPKKWPALENSLLVLPMKFKTR